MRRAASFLAAMTAGAVLWAGPAFAGNDPARDAYLAGEFGLARALWLPRAISGDAAAQYGVGEIYDLGRGVATDATAAYGWYLQAARQGLPQAEYAVAAMTDSGDGRGFDATDAAGWYARAAAHGEANAAYIMGRLYEAGQGVPRNLALALAWYSAARDAKSIRRVAAAMAAPGAASDPSAKLAPPVLLGDDGAGKTDSALNELVWTAPAEAARVRYVVTILAVDGLTLTQIYTATTTVSAIPSPLLAAGDYVWRVYAVSTTGSHYAASAWGRMRR